MYSQLPGAVILATDDYKGSIRMNLLLWRAKLRLQLSPMSWATAVGKNGCNSQRTLHWVSLRGSDSTQPEHKMQMGHYHHSQRRRALTEVSRPQQKEEQMNVTEQNFLKQKIRWTVLEGRGQSAFRSKQKKPNQEKCEFYFFHYRKMFLPEPELI